MNTNKIFTVSIQFNIDIYSSVKPQNRESMWFISFIYNI